MEYNHSHRHNPKRRRLDERIHPGVRQRVEHSSMSTSSLVDQETHHHRALQSLEHSTSYSSAFHAHQTRDSATTASFSPFNLLEQSSSQTAQPFEARCAAPTRHFRPRESFNSYNSSQSQDFITYLAPWNRHNAPALPSQAQVLDPDPAPASYATMPLPHPDLSSEDDDFEDEAQNPNAFTASQVNAGQSAMVCFGMVNWLV